MAGRIIILTGGRDVGKSTICREVVALAQAKQYACGGIITLSMGDGSRIEVLDVRTGNTRVLTVSPDEPGAVLQGSYHFRPDTLSWGGRALAQATPCHLLVVDELGPLELERSLGWATAALDALRGGEFELALVVVRPELIVTAQLRLPQSATVLTVTPDNRPEIPTELLKLLERELRAPA